MSGECLDPETLALWVDDELRGAERAAAERHVADCARCQAALAALVRTVPVPEPRPWWRTLRAAWLAPLAAAATALAVWIAVPSTPPPPSPSRPAVREAQNAPAVAVTPPAVPSRSDEKPVARKPDAVPEPSERKRAAAPEAPAAPPPAPAAAAPAPSAAPPPAAFRAFAPALDSAARVASQANAINSNIVSPDPSIRWRIARGRIVEHTTDGGVTWQEQPTGTTSMLTAGSAPSASICWVVGQDGVVLLTTDGRTWRQLGVPTPTALVTVVAVDDRTATVTDAIGRTYITSDAGVTWTLR